MAGPTKPAAPTPAPPTTTTEHAPGDYAAVKKELDELKDRNKRIEMAVRKLAAGILTPAGVGDKGQGRRNTIGQAIQEVVREFGFNEVE